MFQNNTVRWRIAIVIALLVTIAVSFVPFGRYVLYPFNLLTTFVHESFHALAGLVTGAGDIRLKINPDTSGLTTSRGGWRILVIPAGYVGTTLFGAIFMLINSRRKTERFLFIFLGFFLVFMTLFFGLTNLLTITFGLGVGALAILIGIALKGNLPTFLMSFISIQLALNSLWDIRDLIFISLDTDMPTDAQSMSREILPLPPIAWAIIFALVSAVILVLCLRVAFRSDRSTDSGHGPVQEDIKTEVL
jgi:MFS family permease